MNMNWAIFSSTDGNFKLIETKMWFSAYLDWENLSKLIKKETVFKLAEQWRIQEILDEIQLEWKNDIAEKLYERIFQEEIDSLDWIDSLDIDLDENENSLEEKQDIVENEVDIRNNKYWEMIDWDSYEEKLSWLTLMFQLWMLERYFKISEFDKQKTFEELVNSWEILVWEKFILCHSNNKKNKILEFEFSTIVKYKGMKKLKVLKKKFNDDEITFAVYHFMRMWSNRELVLDKNRFVWFSILKEYESWPVVTYTDLTNWEVVETLLEFDQVNFFKKIIEQWATVKYWTNEIDYDRMFTSKRVYFELFKQLIFPFVWRIIDQKFWNWTFDIVLKNSWISLNK